MTKRCAVYSFLLACLAAGTAAAQVQSLTLGINVNSPYGIGEPWVTIREGLQRLDFVESVSTQPDKEASTGELKLKGDQLPDLDLLAKALRDTGAGASLRGVEGTVEGELAKDGDDLVLRVTGSKIVLRLKPLTKLVQRRQQPTEAERNAYRTLTANWNGEPLRVSVTGPLVKNDEARDGTRDRSPTLEVRKFVAKQ